MHTTLYQYFAGFFFFLKQYILEIFLYQTYGVFFFYSCIVFHSVAVVK